MIYKKYEGNSVSVNIENTDENNVYTAIGAKAFLSCKNVYEVKLPETITKIGDWAFAHMKELKKISVPANKISIGKDAFLDCENLKEIVVYPYANENEGLAYLLASCIGILKAYALLDFEMAAGQNRLWCQLYDDDLIRFIYRPDEADFKPYIVGWFNDEGEEEQLERHMRKVRADKIKLCFLRLKYDANISDDTRGKLISYLKKQIECIVALNYRNDTSWEVFREILSEDIQYVKLAVAGELLSDEMVMELIKYLNDNNKSAEIVAYLVLSVNGKAGSIDDQFLL